MNKSTKYYLVHYRTLGTPVPDELYNEYNGGYEDGEEGYCIVSEEEYIEQFNDMDVYSYAHIVTQLPADSPLVKASQMHKDLVDVVTWMGNFVCTASDGGHAWCAVRDQEGASEWYKKLSELYIQIKKQAECKK